MCSVKCWFVYHLNLTAVEAAFVYAGHEALLCFDKLIQFSKTLEYYGAFQGIIYSGSLISQVRSPT